MIIPKPFFLGFCEGHASLFFCFLDDTRRKMRGERRGFVSGFGSVLYLERPLCLETETTIVSIKQSSISLSLSLSIAEATTNVREIESDIKRDAGREIRLVTSSSLFASEI